MYDQSWIRILSRSRTKPPGRRQLPDLRRGRPRAIVIVQRTSATDAKTIMSVVYGDHTSVRAASSGALVRCIEAAGNASSLLRSAAAGLAVPRAPCAPPLTDGEPGGVALLPVFGATDLPAVDWPELDPMSRRNSFVGRVFASGVVPELGAPGPVELGMGSQYWLIALSEGAPAQPVAACATAGQSAQMHGTTKTTTKLRILFSNRPLPTGLYLSR